MLQEQITADLRLAMKAQNKELTSFLRVVISDITRDSKEASDEEVIKKLKTLKENAIIMSNAYEIGILDSYLPSMFSLEQVREVVIDIVTKGGYTSKQQIGKVMTDVRNHPDVKKIENKLVSEILKDILV